MLIVLTSGATAVRKEPESELLTYFILINKLYYLKIGILCKLWKKWYALFDLHDVDLVYLKNESNIILSEHGKHKQMHLLTYVGEQVQLSGCGWERGAVRGREGNAWRAFV